MLVFLFGYHSEQGLDRLFDQFEERIEKSRRPALRVVTPVTDIQESRSILANGPIKMNNCGAQGSRHLERRKMQSRGKLITSTNNLGFPGWNS